MYKLGLPGIHFDQIWQKPVTMYNTARIWHGSLITSELSHNRIFDIFSQPKVKQKVNTLSKAPSLLEFIASDLKVT